MIVLSKEQVLRLHADLIRATGGSGGILNEGMLDLALNNPFQSFGEGSYIQVFQQKRRSSVLAW